MIQKVKKTVAGQIRSAGRTGPTGRQNRRPFFFTFWIIWSYKNWKKTVAGQIRSAGRSGRPTDRQNRRPFFTFWIIRSRFGKRIFQPKFFNFKIMIWHYIEVKKRFSPDGFSQNTGDYFYCFRNSIFKMVPHSTLELSLDWIGKHILCSKILFNTCMSPLAPTTGANASGGFTSHLIVTWKIILKITFLLNITTWNLKSNNQ